MAIQRAQSWVVTRASHAAQREGVEWFDAVAG